MKLKYKAWKLQGPENSTYSRFPFDMLRYDPAYIHDRDLGRLMGQYEKGGPRVNTQEEPDSYVLVYTWIPGYRSTIQNPTVGRWASFGWPDLEQVREIDLGDLRHWNTAIGFTRSSDPVFLTLQDWVDCRNMDQWAAKISRTKADYDCIRS